MKNKDRTTSEMSWEEKISNLRKIGFSDEEAKKIVADSEKNIWKKIQEGLPALYITLLIVSIGFIAYLLVSLDEQSHKLMGLDERIKKIEVQFTESQMATNEEVSQFPNTATPSYTVTFEAIKETPTPTSIPKIYGEIISDNPNIRSGPGRDFESVGKLKKGTVVEVIGKSTDDISIPASDIWLFIISPENGVKGWLRGDLLELQDGESEIRLNLLPAIVLTTLPSSTP